MKTILLLLILTASVSLYATDPAKITFTKVQGYETIQMEAGNLTIQQAFEELDAVAFWYMNQVVIKDGVKYFRYGLFPKKTFILTEKRFRISKKRVKLT